mmetsp:Transcript_30032/g.94085  ORF Transcript_30032/g.94085 Transcript_30032/m.94085 type:complete len:456 (+) Transcript_30032:416-1783(+)
MDRGQGLQEDPCLRVAAQHGRHSGQLGPAAGRCRGGRAASLEAGPAGPLQRGRAQEVPALLLPRVGLALEGLRAPGVVHRHLALQPPEPDLRVLLARQAAIESPARALKPGAHVPARLFQEHLEGVIQHGYIGSEPDGELKVHLRQPVCLAGGDGQYESAVLRDQAFEHHAALRQSHDGPPFLGVLQRGVPLEEEAEGGPQGRAVRLGHPVGSSRQVDPLRLQGQRAQDDAVLGEVDGRQEGDGRAPRDLLQPRLPRPLKDCTRGSGARLGQHGRDRVGGDGDHLAHRPRADGRGAEHQEAEEADLPEHGAGGGAADDLPRLGQHVHGPLEEQQHGVGRLAGLRDVLVLAVRDHAGRLRCDVVDDGLGEPREDGTTHQCGGDDFHKPKLLVLLESPVLAVALAEELPDSSGGVWVALRHLLDDVPLQPGAVHQTFVPTPDSGTASLSEAEGARLP